MTDARVYLVTGCASGIGRHVATQLAKRGARAYLTDKNFGALREVAWQEGWDAERLKVRGLEVTDADAWEEVVREVTETFGRLDVLLNIAGVLRPGYLHEASPSEVDFHLDINTKGTIYGTLHAARVMTRQGAGHIVNVASLAGVIPTPGNALYCASKFAVRGFSVAAAAELREHGVYVSVICPDAVKTPMLDLQKTRREAALTFTGRALEVEEVSAALFRALERRPVEVLVPASRGLQFKLLGLAPGLVRRLHPTFRKQGLGAQARLKEQEL